MTLKELSNASGLTVVYYSLQFMYTMCNNCSKKLMKINASFMPTLLLGGLMLLINGFTANLIYHDHGFMDWSDV